jgi:hypothetical protein
MGERVYGFVTVDSIQATRQKLISWVTERWMGKALEDITTLEIQSFLQKVHELG